MCAAYLHRGYYARLANKPYDPAQLAKRDPEEFLSVSAYSSDRSAAERQERMTNKELGAALAEEVPSLNYGAMTERMVQLLRELFSEVAPSIGSWPRSSAYYAVDVLFDNHPAYASQPTPILLEVNYMGDWIAMSNSTESTMEHFSPDYIDWVRDLLCCLGTSAPMNLDRNIKL